MDIPYFVSFRFDLLPSCCVPCYPCPMSLPLLGGVHHHDFSATCWHTKDKVLVTSTHPYFKFTFERPKSLRTMFCSRVTLSLLTKYLDWLIYTRTTDVHDSMHEQHVFTPHSCADRGPRPKIQQLQCVKTLRSS